MSDDSPPSSSHWCYHCNKRVFVETLENENNVVVCCECNKGFVESISSSPAPPPPPPPQPRRPISPDLTVDDSSIGSHFLQMLRLLAHAPSSQQRSSPDVLSYEDDFFRLEINSRNEIDDDEDEEEEEEDEEEENLTVVDEEEEDLMRRREIFPLATTRSRTGRNRILDWAEILMGIEDNSIEFRMETTDRYTGNPADYIDDAAGYEALLQNLAEGDGGNNGRRGAPPAGKSTIEALETFEVGGSFSEVCAVCKDAMVIGEIGKKLPCGHCYHVNCIVPWLGTRNSCPVCRFQLKTDDAEYEEEEERKKRNSTDGYAASSSASRH